MATVEKLGEYRQFLIDKENELDRLAAIYEHKGDDAAMIDYCEGASDAYGVALGQLNRLLDELQKGEKNHA